MLCLSTDPPEMCFSPNPLLIYTGRFCRSWVIWLLASNWIFSFENPYMCLEREISLPVKSLMLDLWWLFPIYWWTIKVAHSHWQHCMCELIIILNKSTTELDLCTPRQFFLFAAQHANLAYYLLEKKKLADKNHFLSLRGEKSKWFCTRASHFWQ